MPVSAQVGEQVCGQQGQGQRRAGMCVCLRKLVGAEVVGMVFCVPGANVNVNMRCACRTMAT